MKRSLVKALMLPSNRLHLLEPTLFDQSGHNYTYVQSLITANKNFNFALHVWMDKRGDGLLQNFACVSRAYFYRPLRRVQKIPLYYKLLQNPDIICVGTSELWDLQLLAWIARRIKASAKVILHFHQFKQTPKKIASLQRIAAMQLNFAIITPSEKLTAFFQQHGFANATTIYFPTYYPAPKINIATAKFAKVLYAGAARNDKGFPAVIDLLQYNREQNRDTFFEIQISAPNSQRYDAPTKQALKQLADLPATNLQLHEDTLNAQQYLQLFNNAICLLLYNQHNYHDKFSGVALDAFYAGCPIITAKHTWMGDVVEQYGAGITLSDYAPTSVQAAIDHIAENYQQFHANAQQAALSLRALHDPSNTLDFIRAQCC